MAIIEITLGLLLAVAAVGALGKWAPLPLPLLLVAAGVLLGYVPGFGSFAVEPELFFLLFIPPLLFADGWLIPKRDLINVLRPVLLLAFGLVLATTLVVGYLLHWLAPELPLAVGFALGAVVSPTDAVASVAVMEKLKVPPRVTHIVNGESLINDASGLVAFKFAVAAVVTGAFSWSEAGVQFVVLSGGGFALGLAVAWLIGHLRVALKRFCIDDPTIQTTLSVLTPYAAYLAAEGLHVGGILAVVAAGLYAGVHDTRHLDTPTRLHSWEVWRMLLYVFNGLVFLLLGVQLHQAFAGMTRTSAPELAGYALAIAAAVVIVRVLWVFPGAYLPRLLSKRIRSREAAPGPRLVFLVGWAGIRGSVTLAAALSIPLLTASGAPFPGRNLVILLASSVIVITLLLNALTLPLFIRWFGIRASGPAETEERAARIATAQAAADAIRRELPRLQRPEEVDFARRLLAEYEQRLHDHTANSERRTRLAALRDAEKRIRLAALSAERDELMQLRDGDVINDEVLRVVQTDIDHAESLLAGSTRRGQ